MSSYNYKKRPIESTQAERVAKASDTSMSVENARALYFRPTLIHSGPCVNFTSSQPEPIGWPWVRFDTDAEKNTLIDKCVFYPQHPTGSLDVSLRVIVATAASSGNNSDDPYEVESSIDVSFVVNVLQYQDGSATPLVKATATFDKTLSAYPATPYPLYPALSLLNLGWIFFDTVDYDKDIQLWGSPLIAGNEAARPPQLYETDFKILQTVAFSIPFTDNLSPEYPVIVEVRANYGGSISYSDKIPGNNRYRTDLNPLQYVRLFNVASSIYERGI